MTTDQRPPDELADLADLMREGQDAWSRSVAVDPAARRRRRRALAITGGVFVAVLLTVTGYVVWALNAPLEAPVVTSSTPQIAAPATAVALPLEGASAISVAGGDDYLGPDAGGLWLTSGTGEARPIASITKLITALVILEAHPLADAVDPGPTIRFDKADHDLYDQYYVRGATIAAMPTGSSMSLHDALATMLIPSASNYADAVSTWAFGSRIAFVSAARDWLARQGLSGTTVVEPTGLDPRNTSTPSDLMAIAKLAAAHPVIASIAATPSLSIPGPGTMFNTNDLLGRAGITGLKTGNLGDGTYALLYTSTLDVGADQPLSVTGVVLGGATRDSVDHSVLVTLGSIRDGFRDVPVATEGREIGSIATSWGSTAQIAIAESASLFTWSDNPITVAVDLDTPRTYADGEVIGKITWSAGPNSVAVDLVVVGDIEPPTDWWRLTHPSEPGRAFLGVERLVRRVQRRPGDRVIVRIAAV